MHLFTIFMPHIAAKLIEKGFVVVKTEPNKKHPNLLVYKFEETPELHLALEEILRKE